MCVTQCVWGSVSKYHLTTECVGICEHVCVGEGDREFRTSHIYGPEKVLVPGKVSHCSAPLPPNPQRLPHVP